MKSVSGFARIFHLKSGELDCSAGCRLMGILNVTPDSFSDGGRFTGSAEAVDHALRMIEEGADVIDIGGESTRPGAEELTGDEELERVLPVIGELRRHTGIPLSIDTRKAAVARAAVREGADIINDISALRHDSAMADVAASEQVPVILMHMQGRPATMQDSPSYVDIVAEVKQFFIERLEFCRFRGITQVIVDPGIGFGKLLQHNLALLRSLPELTALGVPVLVGTSRKSFLGQITGQPVDKRLPGSIASNIYACMKGAGILRVHDVAEVGTALQVVQAIEQLTDEVQHAV